MVAVNGYAERFAENVRRNQAWALRNGYEFRLITQPENLPRNDCGWLKIAVAEQLLQKHAAVLSLDTDAYVTDACPALETVLQPAGSLSMCLGKSGRLNSGVLLYQQSLLTALAICELFRQAHKEVPAPYRAPQENGHVIWLWSHWPQLRILDGRWNQIEPEGAYIVHGHQNPGAFKQRIRKAQKPQPDWYYELTEKRRAFTRVRIRYYARRLAEIGAL